MNTLTGQRTRTITGYVYTLLEYPRILIERDVDFSHCRHGGVFDPDEPECVSCEFGNACRWLNRHRATSLDEATLAELIDALTAAADYLQKTTRHDRHCDCETCKWLLEARGFLRHRPDET
jgi:hypothetical protein